MALKDPNNHDQCCFVVLYDHLLHCTSANLQELTVRKKWIYLLTSFTSEANGFSQPYIFITRIPEMTSFMVRILSSVRIAVSALKQRDNAAGAPEGNGDMAKTGDGTPTSEWRTGVQKQSVRASE